MIRITGKTQADGAFPVPYPEHDESGTIHTIQFTVRDSDGVPAVPAAGTVTVKVKTPGGGDFEKVPNNVANLTNRDNWLMPPLFPIPVQALQFIPADLDGDKTYDIAINSSFGSGA